MHSVETANATLLETQYHLETRVLQLQDKLTQASRPSSGAVRKGGGASATMPMAAPPSLAASHAHYNHLHSENMDILPGGSDSGHHGVVRRGVPMPLATPRGGGAMSSGAGSDDMK